MPAPTHSLLITHRDRELHLKLCLWSIRRSAEACGRTDYEVLVVENGSRKLPDSAIVEESRTRLIVDKRTMPVFNKSALYNAGIAKARGQVLWFLDADALVGSRFLDAADVLLADPTYTKVCFRVMYLDEPLAMQLAMARDRGPHVDRLFADYYGGGFTRAYEAWRSADHNAREPGEQPHGNSQFAISRTKLADLRYDERYEGKGFEDLDFNRRLQRREGLGYKAILRDAPQWNMFHFEHDADRDLLGWTHGRFTAENCKRFKADA